MRLLIDFVHPRGQVKIVKLDNGETWTLNGECSRCGECCEKTKMPLEEFQKEDGTCKYLSYEKVNGEKLAKCNIMWNRPAFCLIYPRDPYEELCENCGFRWEKIN